MTARAKPLGAWTRRRAAVQAEAEALEQVKVDALIAEKHAELAEKTESEALAELDLPDPDHMVSGDDFSAFMKAAVPTHLRNRALRTLWRSNPALANVDMLVDYGEDFTSKGDTLAVVKTIYRVGKGMLRDKSEDEDMPGEDIDQASGSLGVEEAENEDPATVLAEGDAVPAPETEPYSIAALSEPEMSDLAPRRRMRFDFQEGNKPENNGMERS